MAITTTSLLFRKIKSVFTKKSASPSSAKIEAKNWKSQWVEAARQQKLKDLAYLLDGIDILSDSSQKQVIMNYFSNALNKELVDDFTQDYEQTIGQTPSQNLLKRVLAEIAVDVDKLIDDLSDKEKESLSKDREYMNPVKFLIWFVQNRPNSRYIGEFRKIKGHIKKMDSVNWRSPLDRDPIVSHRVQTQYELMRANSRSLKGNVPHYVIYALMQKRDLYTGIPLQKPLFEVGYKTSPRSMKKILNDHKVSLLHSLRGPSNVYFRIAYFKSLQEEGVIPQEARFHDYFEAVPIDMAATSNQMKDLEKFWTIYLNRLSGRRAYGLEYNKFFNAIVGDKFDNQRVRIVVDEINSVAVELDERKYYVYISKENLDSFIELGFDKKDLMWYFRESQKTISKIVNYYYPDKNFRDIQKEVVTNRLRQLARDGMPYSELINYFYKCDTHARVITSRYKDSSFIPVITQYTTDKILSRVDKYIGGINAYNEIFFNSYLKPHLLEMQAQGLITRETLISVLKGELTIPNLDYTKATGVASTSFRWLFQELFGPDIISVLASKDYGSGFVPFQFLKDLNIYVEGDFNFNNRMASHLRTIIKLMFDTIDLSAIYRQLNAGIL